MQIKIEKIKKKIQDFLENIHIPMLDISLWGLLEIYIGGLFKNQITKQGASISWSFFFSLFPFILFLLSVLPYLPHYGELHNYIFEVLMPRALPEYMQEDVIGYIEQHIIPKIEGISNFTTIILVLFFATNGTYALINGFNENTDTQRGIVVEYVLAFFITLGFTLAVVVSILGIYYAEIVLKLLMPEYQQNWFASHLTEIISYVSFPLFYFLALASLYWVGTKKLTKFWEATPGAILTTTLFMLTTYGFAVYIKEFSQYNVLYGSVGTIILLMLWVNINVILVLIGNELNLAIKKIHTHNKKQSK